MARKAVKNRGKTGQKRDPQGRFLPGTAAGPGRPANPYARRLAALKVAFAKAVSIEDVQAIAGKLVDLAKRGDVGAVKVLLAALIGPVAPVDPDEIDRHEFGVRARMPTEVDALMLSIERNDNGGRPELADVEDAEADGDAPAPEPEPDGPDGLTGWEEFAAGRLEWDPQAACPMDLLYVQYARWCASMGVPLLPEEDVCAWLQENGGTFVRSPYAQMNEVQGMRVVA